MRDQDRIAVLSGLLDFYSDRATAHASFTVAEVFGIYTVIFAHREFFSDEGLTANIPGFIKLLVFVSICLFLLILNVYSFLNFSYFATLADVTREKLLGQCCDEWDRHLEYKLRNRLRILDTFRIAKKRIYDWKMKFALLFFFWLVITVLPFLWILLQHFR